MRKIVLFVPTLIVLLCIMLWLISPQKYIAKHTGFTPVFALTEYHYERISQGKDYDTLYVFSLSRYDSNRLSDVIQADHSWSSLPMSTEAASDDLLSPYYDQRLSVYALLQKGYYLYTPNYELCIFDYENNILVIRTRSNRFHYHNSISEH